MSTAARGPRRAERLSLLVLAIAFAVAAAVATAGPGETATNSDGAVTVKGLLSFMNGIAGQGGDNGNVITGDLTHQDGKLSSNGIVLDTHKHGGVQRGGSDTDGPK